MRRILILASALSIGATVLPVSAQTPSALLTEIPRTAQGKPKLDGIWQTLTTANWDIRPHASAPAPIDELGARGAVPPGLGIVVGNEIPYQDWAAEKQKENEADTLALDPEVKCFMPGVPRANYMPHPFQIFQTEQYVMMAYQYAGAVRTIHMDDPGPSPTSFWMGWSVGRWEGDTLVVEVTAQHPDTWFDRAGNFHSEDLRVVERYTMIGPNHLQYEATIEDAKVFTGPWSISVPLYRRIEPNAQLIEFKCVPYSEEVLYGHLRRKADDEQPNAEQSGD